MIKFKRSSEEINSNAGLSVVAKRLNGNSLFANWNKLGSKANNIKYENTHIIKSIIALVSLGYSDYSAISKLKKDALLRDLIGNDIPSEETLRQRFESISRENWQETLDLIVIEELKKVNLTPVHSKNGSYIPIDIDVSVLIDKSSQKEGIGMTYMGVKGYAPIFCYAGSEGYMVANELRPGSQHSANGAIDFLKRCIRIVTEAGYKREQLLVRVDSGHDDSAFIGALGELGVNYIVKRNLRKEIPEQILDSIRSSADQQHNRSGKITYTGFRSDRMPAKVEKYSGFMLVRAVERTITAEGERLLFPVVEMDCWWTNLPEHAENCYEIYKDHATSEQFHSELKHDLGIELLPSGKMQVNSLFLALTTIAYNILRFIGQIKLEALSAKNKKPGKLPLRYRLRTVLLDLIKVGCKIVSHARRTWLSFGRNCPAFTYLKFAYARC